MDGTSEAKIISALDGGTESFLSESVNRESTFTDESPFKLYQNKLKNILKKVSINENRNVEYDNESSATSDGKENLSAKLKRINNRRKRRASKLYLK